MSEVELHRYFATRHAPTMRPMLPPWPHLVAVTDTNALLRRACNSVRQGRPEDLFTGLSLTGRSNTLVASHVPRELAVYLGTVAGSARVDAMRADRVLWNDIMPSIPVVDLPVREYLHPRIRPMLSIDRELPRSLRGDPDDVGTAALAEFLAPAVILSADSVFFRLGLTTTTALAWLETAYSMMRAAGFEASIGDAAMIVELAMKAIFWAGGAAFRLALRYPFPAMAIIGAALYFAHRLGYLQFGRVRATLQWLRIFAEPFMETFAEAASGHSSARASISVVEPYGEPTLEQRVARYLARRGRVLTPGELRDELRVEVPSVTAAGLKRVLAAHPAFVRWSGDVYSVGQPANRPDLRPLSPARRLAAVDSTASQSGILLA